jgi:diacylglycerol kinase family enzyme
MDVAVVVNLHARRGSEAIGRMVRQHLPNARVSVTRSLDEVREFLATDVAPRPPGLLLSGGGDGTAVALLNELRAQQIPMPRFGVLRLGTGNGWANATSAPEAEQAIERIAQLSATGRTPPMRRFGLVESAGQVAPFLGTGWDAEIISDFKAQQKQLPGAFKPVHAGLFGYLKGVVTRTIPRHLRGSDSPQVTLVNLGDDALTIDEQGHVVPVPGGGRGAVLYRGLASVAAAATTEELGFGFRAFPFAHAAPGRLSARIYSGRVMEAVRNSARLWRGVHPMPNMHDFFLTHGRMDFDREVPLQIGGDLGSPCTSFEFRLAPEGVELVDWSRLSA